MVDGVEYGQSAIEKLCLVLCEISDLHIMADFQRARKWNFAHNAFYQGGFAFTVFAYECHFFTSANGECGIVKHLVAAI